jgi:urease accessory protein UreF
MTDVAETLHHSFTSLLSVAVRVAEVGQDEEARRLVELATKIQGAEENMLTHTKDAGMGKIMKLNVR